MILSPSKRPKKAIQPAKQLAILLGIFLGFSSCTASQGLVDFEASRNAMVESQIIARGVTSPAVLAALRTVPRHEFVPQTMRSLAYSDQPLPIGDAQTISQPYIVAIMTELLDLKAGDKVLEIGTGSGYQAAVLAEITPAVFTIEIIESLAEKAKQTLTKLGYTSVAVKAGDGFLGWPEHAPFNAILVTCAVPEMPQPLLEQLADGGRLVAPVDRAAGYQSLKKYLKVKGSVQATDILDVRFVPMTGEHINNLLRERE